MDTNPKVGDESTFTVTIRSVGPVTRTTVGNERPDSRLEVLGDVIHWVWSWRVQVTRFGESTRRQFEGRTTLEHRTSASRASYDEHMLVVAGWNLARALDCARKLYPEFPLGEKVSELLDPLRYLRHLYEHWDEQRLAFQDERAEKILSAKKFLERFPQGRPWEVVYDKDEWLLAGVIPILEFSAALESIEAEALRLEEERLLALRDQVAPDKPPCSSPPG